MRGWILYVLASLFALSASLAWRLGEPSPWQALSQPVDAMVVRSAIAATADGAREPEVVVAFEVGGLRRETEVFGLGLESGDAANAVGDGPAEVPGWPSGAIRRVVLPDGPLGPVYSANAPAQSWALAIALTLLAATSVLAGLVWSLRHDLRGAPTEHPREGSA